MAEMASGWEWVLFWFGLIVAVAGVLAFSLYQKGGSILAYVAGIVSLAIGIIMVNRSKVLEEPEHE